MLTVYLLVKMFLIGFALNLVWEFAHCQLYETCRRQSWSKNIPLLVTMSLKDGLFIVLFYLMSLLAAGWEQLAFVVLALGFAFADEKISVARGRWEYTPAMPTVFGVGVTPLLEIAATGVLTFSILGIS